MPDPISNAVISQALKQLPGWEHENDALKRSFKFADFNEALGFIVRVGLLAEQQGHHPELFNVYNTVCIALNTHDAGGKVTQKDLDLATAIQNIGA